MTTTTFMQGHDKLKSFVIILIYIQIGCAMIGCLGALYNGASLMNLVVSLFALVAIESGSQNLIRTYSSLLVCMIILDVAWFVLYSQTIWNFTPDERNGLYFVFSLGLTLSMQIMGFSVRFISSFLWIQVYRSGNSATDETSNIKEDLNSRKKHFNPSFDEVVKKHDPSDDIIGGSIYDEACFSSLFDDVQDRECLGESSKQTVVDDDGSMSAHEGLQRWSGTGRSCQAMDQDCRLIKWQAKQCSDMSTFSPS